MTIRTILFFILFLIGGSPMVSAQDQFTETRFEGQQITGVEIYGTFNVRIRKGEETKATVSIPLRFRKQLVFRLNNGKLEIGLEGKTKIKSNEKDLFTADIVCSDLNMVDLSGASKLTVEGDVATPKFVADLSGASSMVLEGQLEVADYCVIEISGASGFRGAMKARSIAGEFSGASDIEMKGETASFKLDVSGTSHVNLKEMKLTSLSADVSGVSELIVGDAESLILDVSGVSSVRYRGNPKIVMDVSGVSAVKRED